MRWCRQNKSCLETTAVEVQDPAARASIKRPSTSPPKQPLYRVVIFDIAFPAVPTRMQTATKTPSPACTPPSSTERSSLSVLISSTPSPQTRPQPHRTTPYAHIARAADTSGKPVLAVLQMMAASWGRPGSELCMIDAACRPR